jgi:hypothetical protein
MPGISIDKIVLLAIPDICFTIPYKCIRHSTFAACKIIGGNSLKSLL